MTKLATVFFLVFLAPVVQAQVSLVTPELPASLPREDTLTVGWEGIDRPVILLIPSGYDPLGQHPLVFALHGGGEELLGGGESKKGFRGRRQALVDYADEKGVVLVMPQGIDGRTKKYGWNGFDDRNPSDDVSFFMQMIDWLENELAIDTTRIYFAGFSAGAGMTQRMAAEQPERVRAVVAIGMSVGFERPEKGNTLQILCGDDCNIRCGPNCGQVSPGLRFELSTPRAPVPIAIIRGGADQVICPTRRCGGGRVHDTVTEQVRFWLAANGCDEAQSTTEKVARGGELRRFDVCSDDASVHIYFVPNLDHSWPRWADRPVLDFLLTH